MKLKWGLIQKAGGDAYYTGECKGLTGVLDWGHIVEMRSPVKDGSRIWREITGEHGREIYYVLTGSKSARGALGWDRDPRDQGR